MTPANDPRANEATPNEAFGETPESAEPRKRTRSRKPREEHVESAAFDAAILPPSIAPAPAPEVASDDAPATPKPRRRTKRVEGEAPQAS